MSRDEGKKDSSRIRQGLRRFFLCALELNRLEGNPVGFELGDICGSRMSGLRRVPVDLNARGVNNINVDIFILQIHL